MQGFLQAPAPAHDFPLTSIPIDIHWTSRLYTWIQHCFKSSPPSMGLASSDAQERDGLNSSYILNLLFNHFLCFVSMQYFYLHLICILKHLCKQSESQM